MTPLDLDEGTVCLVRMFDLFLQSPAAPDLMYHWSDMGKPMIVKGRTYRPAPIVEVDMPLSKSVVEYAQDVSGRIVVWSSDLSRLWCKGKYMYAELVLSLGFLRKDNRVSVVPNHHYEWQGQLKAISIRKRCCRLGATRQMVSVVDSPARTDLG